jgi:hypothetical protein
MSTPYELLARFNPDGTVAGIHVKTIETVNGRDYESDPIPLNNAKDPVFAQFASAFSSSIVAERDALLESAGDIAALESQVASLTAELESYRNPPFSNRHIPPFSFMSRFTNDELVAILTSGDMVIRVAMAKLQTIITYVDLDLEETQQLVGYLVSVGILQSDRASQILANVTSDEV